MYIVANADSTMRWMVCRSRCGRCLPGGQTWVNAGVRKERPLRGAKWGVVVQVRCWEQGTEYLQTGILEPLDSLVVDYVVVVVWEVGSHEIWWEKVEGNKSKSSEVTLSRLRCPSSWRTTCF